MSAALPPNVGILLRGAEFVLGCCVAVSVGVGVVLDDLTAVVNSVGFLGVCVLSCGAVFYSLGLSRSGIPTVGAAARTMVRVLAGSAVATTLLHLLLLRDATFRAEVCEPGPASVIGLAVLALVGWIAVVLRHER